MMYVVQNSGFIFRQDRVIDVNAPKYQAVVSQIFSNSDSLKFVISDDQIKTTTQMLYIYRAYICNQYGRRIELPKQASVVNHGLLWFNVGINQMRKDDICWIEVQEYYADPSFQILYYSNPFKVISSNDSARNMTNLSTPQRKISMLVSGMNTANYDVIYLNGSGQNVFPNSKFGIRVNVSFYRTPKRSAEKEIYEEHFGKKTNLLVESFDVWTIKFTGMTNEQANVVKTLINTDNFMIGDAYYKLYSDELEEITVDGVKEYTLSGDFINISIDSDKYTPNLLSDPMRYFIQRTTVTPPTPPSPGLRILRLGRTSGQTDIGIVN